MIVTQIYKGQGLGNQLWCYVTTRVIAADRGFDFGIMTPENFKCNDFMNLDFGLEVTGGDGPEGGPPDTLPVGIANYYKERQIRHPISKADISAYDPELVNIPDQTKIDGTMQDEKYILHRKSEIHGWLKVRPEFECTDYASDDICVINFRGGEYRFVKDVFLPRQYWDDAVKQMRIINPNFRFIVITEDVNTAKKFFPDFEVQHFSIAKDFIIIKNAHYLIIANTSFAWFPAWLNTNLKLCIAPKYWWAYNQSDGYWACDFNITREWKYLDRQGNLQDSEACQKELAEYHQRNATYYTPKKIERNFLVVSNNNNDLSWIPRRTENYLIYNKQASAISPYTVESKNVLKSINLGYNLYDYFSFIIDHYDRLPEVVAFITGDIFPREVSEQEFDSLSNNQQFTPIIGLSLHRQKKLVGRLINGVWSEPNTSWYLRYHPIKYFYSYNDFLRFCYSEPIIPEQVPFAPGGNYIVPRSNILKLPKVAYENLRTIISHCSVPGEAHIIERALLTLWTSDMRLSEQFVRPIDTDRLTQLNNGRKSPFIPPELKWFNRTVTSARQTITWYARKIPPPIHSLLRPMYFFARNSFLFFRSFRNIFEFRNAVMKAFRARSSKAQLVSVEVFQENRKKVKLYDAFYLFNELDILELRLNILDPYVDYFVIVEATETFSGKPKELFYQLNQERFKKFKHKIIHHITTDTPKDEDDLRQRLYQKNISESDREIICNTLTSDNIPKGQIQWLKEFYQKESLKKALTGLQDDDFVFVSDVDEIWNPVINFDITQNHLYKYKQDAYYYFLNNRSSDDWQTGWTGTVATKYKNIRHNCINHLRTHTKNTYAVLKNGGWHFTFQGGADRIRKKLESYGHQEFNIQTITSQLETVMAENRDYRGRPLRFWADESKLPAYLIANKDHYQQLFRPN